MQAKREYVILFFIIAALSLYLFMKKTDKTHYSLPEVPSISKEEITRVNIKKGDSEILLQQEGDSWLVLPQKYPAAANEVDKMVETLADLSLTALVSESKNYLIYELDEEKKISVQAFQGDDLVRSLDIGKSAPSRGHTFVKLADDDRVYHAAENFRDRFDKDIAALRDKQVLKIEDRDSITEMILASTTESLHIVRAPVPADVDLNKDPDKDGEAPPPELPKWQTAEGKQIKEEDEIDTLVTTLSDLKCDQFIEDANKEDFKEPAFVVSLKGIQDYEFSLHEKQEEKYIATSSGSEYPFLIPEWRANKIKLELGDLVAPESEE